MPIEPTTLIDLSRPVLERQHSLITRRQALGLGNSEACIRRLLRLRVWEVIEPGLYGPTGVSMTWRRRLMSVILAGPDGAVASHRAAAALHDVGGLDDPPIEITIPRGSTFRRDDVVTHESCDLAVADLVLVDGIPTTDLRRLAIDLGAVVSPERYKHSIREIRHRHGVTRPQLLATYLAHKRRGRNGGGALRDWLDRYLQVDGTPESGLEQVVLDALLDAGLPAPVLQLWVSTDAGSYRIDLAFPLLRIALEVDGMQHGDVDIAAADARRTRALQRAGLAGHPRPQRSCGE